MTSNHTICVSGGFDPLHAGHLEMFREAAQYGRVVVILNSDDWLVRKKGFFFLPWSQRAAIIGDLQHVYEVVPVEDADDTVCEALYRLRPRWFANGGDRKPGNTPEAALCEKLHVELLWNIGGAKANSSTDIARRAWVQRPWGQYVTLDEGAHYKVKKVVVDPGQAISLQYHQHRSEFWFMAGPGAAVNLDGEMFHIEAGSPPVVVERGMRHQLINGGREPLVVIEIQSGDYLGEDDIIRLRTLAETEG